MQTKIPNVVEAQRGVRLSQSAQKTFSDFLQSRSKISACVVESTIINNIKDYSGYAFNT